METEKRNTNSEKLDLLDIREIIDLMNEESHIALNSVESAGDDIEKLIDEALRRNVKRVIYAGAGTSGRLGVLDASECPPTFNTEYDEFIGLIAGGDKALRYAIEGAEDSIASGKKDIEKLRVDENDCVVGIAASGRTPYIIGVLERANKAGALTGSISNNRDSEISKLAVCPIEISSGAEILTGSTRLKAGTTQKLVLNMISTIINIKRGKVYGNYMVDVSSTNNKLENRAINMIREITGVDENQASEAFHESGKHVKTAVVMLVLDIDAEKAESMIEKEQNLRNIIEKNQG